MACPKTEDPPVVSKSEVKVEVMENGVPMDGSAIYHAHSTTEKAKFTLSGVVITRLKKDTDLQLKVTCLGPVRLSYIIPAVTARMAISQKRWW